MFTLRQAHERGSADHGWLRSHHTFSFADYYDPRFMGFGPLRVINDDTVAGGGGFPPHPHRDMEIISYVIDGALEHRDNLGNGSVIRRGEVQRMSAGAGIVHSEFNASQTDPVHFLQIWILPRDRVERGYGQAYFSDEQKRGRLCLLASPDGTDGSLVIHQDVRLMAALLGAEHSIRHAIDGARKGWLHVVAGHVDLGPHHLDAGDGVAIEGRQDLLVSSPDQGELLLFDLPA